MTRPLFFQLIVVMLVLLSVGRGASAEEAVAEPSAPDEDVVPAAPAPAPPVSPDEGPFGEGAEGRALDEDARDGDDAGTDEVVDAPTGGESADAVETREEPTGTEQAVAETAGAEGEARAAWHEGLLDGLGETDPIFSISRGAFSLGILGSIQLLGVPFVQDPWASIEAGSIANAEGFRLRRARFGVSGELTRWVAFQLRIEHGDEGAGILDANITLDFLPLVRITAGALKVPFSRTMMLSSEYQTFLQRPYGVRLVAPDRSLGVEISGDAPWFSFAAGVFNGGGDLYRGDNNEGMLYAGRFAVHPLGALPAGEITLPESLVFQVAASYYYNQDATGDRHAAAGDVVLRWSGLTISGEFLWSTFNPSGSPMTAEGVEYGHTDRMGWFAEASYFILPGHLQVAVRHDGQLVQEAVDIRDINDLWGVSGVINGYLLEGRIKLSLQYEHRHEWFDVQVPNDYLSLQLQGRI